MQKLLTVEFTKMDGAGNDFIVIDNRFYYFSDSELASIAKRFCTRRTGIGADGLLALNAPQTDGAHMALRYFNADGSIGMCGNGARCLVWFAHLSEIAADRYIIETDSGIYEATIEGDGFVKMYVPEPHSYSPDLDVSEWLPESPPGSYIWTGTDHAVLFVDDLDSLAVTEIGRLIRYCAALSPAGSNVNFVAIPEGRANQLVVRTYERGVEAETLACGTGAMATALVAVLQGRIDGPPVSVRMPGGILDVDFVTGENGEVRNVSLSGPARVTYRGTIQLPRD